jgi:hypothetical protein
MIIIFLFTTSTFKIASITSYFFFYTHIVVSILVKKKLTRHMKKNKCSFTNRGEKDWALPSCAPEELMEFFLRGSSEALTFFALRITNDVFFMWAHIWAPSSLPKSTSTACLSLLWVWEILFFFIKLGSFFLFLPSEILQKH